APAWSRASLRRIGSWGRNRPGRSGEEPATVSISLRAPFEVCQHEIHAIDFSCLIGEHVGCKTIHRAVLRRTGHRQELPYHRDRALVMLDHEGEKQPIELG